MYNRKFDITSEGVGDLASALRLAWSNAVGGKATHFYITRYAEKTEYRGMDTGFIHHRTGLVEDKQNGTPTLVLLYHEGGQAQALVNPFGLAGAVLFVSDWLERADYGPMPQLHLDGSCQKGWRVFNEEWGNVDGHQYAIAAIQSVWAKCKK